MRRRRRRSGSRPPTPFTSPRIAVTIIIHFHYYYYYYDPVHRFTASVNLSRIVDTTTGARNIMIHGDLYYVHIRKKSAYAYMCVCVLSGPAVIIIYCIIIMYRYDCVTAYYRNGPTKRTEVGGARRSRSAVIDERSTCNYYNIYRGPRRKPAAAAGQTTRRGRNKNVTLYVRVHLLYGAPSDEPWGPTSGPNRCPSPLRPNARDTSVRSVAH